MKAGYNKLQEYFDKKLPEPKTLAGELTFHSYEVEDIEKTDGDYIFNIDVLPNRQNDSFDESGVAKELSAILNIPLRSKASQRAGSDIKIDVSVSEINKLLGTNISVKEIEDIFRRLGFMFDLNGEDFTVNPPLERTDLKLKADIIEEVGRIHGYENINAVLPEKPKEAPRINKKFYYANRIKNFLVKEGFSEVYTYTFRNEGEVEIEKPFASDKNFLRADLRAGLSNTLQQNIKNMPLLDGDDIKIFEIGNVFDKNGEHTSLGIGYFGDSRFVIDDIISRLFNYLQTTYDVVWSENIFETNLDDLIKKLPEPSDAKGLFLDKTKENVVFKPISQYPFVLRDISVWVPKDKTSDDVLNIIKEKAGDWLANTKLFDEFKKDGKISYAFNLVFQSKEKTLSDKEVNEIINKITEALNANTNWKVRD